MQKEMNYNDMMNVVVKMRECSVLKDSRRCTRNCDSCKLLIPEIEKIRAYNYVLAIMQSLVPILNNEDQKPKRTRKKKEVSNETNKETNKTTKRVSTKKKEGS